LEKSSKNPLINDKINTRSQFAYSAHLPNTVKNLNNNYDIQNIYSNTNIYNNNINYTQQNLFDNIEKQEKEHQNQPLTTLFTEKEYQNQPLTPLLYENEHQNQTDTPFLTGNSEIMSDTKCYEYYRTTINSPVTSYGYSQDQNAKHRNYMEDEGRVVENFTGDPNKILFCIFDGHGGGQVSKYLQENFYKYMKNFYNYKNYNAAFVEIFRKVDEDIKLLNCPNVGSTATIVYIEKQKDNKKILYCANVGDSRCVLVSKNGVYRLSYDDRVKDPIENERINKNGGIIVNNRVYGQLMLSRSFGDWKIKDVGVIVDPHITRFELDDDSLFVVIASDGVWDVLKDEECSILEKMYVNTGEMCKKIIGECLKRKSLDNLSCFVISLK
jgi:serine/threonine protein phosphatase PrpC